MIRLTKFESEGFYEARTLTQNDYREVPFKQYRNESSPAGMGAKTKGSMLHKLQSKQPVYVAKVTRRTHISKGQKSIDKRT